MVINIVRPRIETEYGTTDKIKTKLFDTFMRRARDRGWLNPKKYIDFGISKGVVLHIGHGPGFTGLEWLKQTNGTKLIALDVSTEMIQIAKRNIKEYPGFENRIKYVNCSAEKMDIETESIDGVFCNGEVHEWPNPLNVFNEINRVLKPGGKYYILAHRRDLSFFTLLCDRFFIVRGLPKGTWEFYMESINASYKYNELDKILKKSDLKKFQLTPSKWMILTSGEK